MTMVHWLIAVGTEKMKSSIGGHYVQSHPRCTKRKSTPIKARVLRLHFTVVEYSSAHASSLVWSSLLVTVDNRN